MPTLSSFSGRERSTWEQTALRLAHLIAQCRSQDPYVQVGCCGIKHDNQIVLGYNGCPPSVEIDWSDRNDRRPYVLHAEANMLDLVRPGELKIVAVTHLPCPECIKRLSKYKVKEVVYSSSDYKCDTIQCMKMAKTLDITLRQMI